MNFREGCVIENHTPSPYFYSNKLRKLILELKSVALKKGGNLTLL